MLRLFIYLGFVLAISGVCGATSSECAPSAALQAKLQKQPKADTYAEAGIWYADHHKYACAVQAYRSALQEEPKSPDFLYSLGLNLIREGDVSVAEKPLQQSIELNPSALKSHLLLATALEDLGRGPQARTQWLTALKIDPQSEMALDGASKNFLATHEFDPVIALLDHEPKGENLTLDLASAYQGSGSVDQAIEVLKKGLDSNPSSLVLTRELITNLALRLRYQEAVKLGEKMVQQFPRDLDAQVLYLHVLVLSHDENVARPLAHKLLVSAPHNFGVLYLNGLLENRSGNYSRARTFLQEAVALNPNHPDSHYNLAIALMNLNNPQGAREQFERTLALGASDPGIRVKYAEALRAAGETNMADEQLKLYQQQQEAKADRTMAAMKMVQADQALNTDPKGAVELYRDAIAALPDYALLQYKLSVALDRTGDIDGERAALQKALEMDPSMAIAYRQLGYLAFNGGDFATAETHFRQAVEAAPTFADAWVSLAATLATESRHQEAETAVQRALEIDPQNANAVDLQKELLNTTQSHP
ncbi:MAG TPA: tetratricopeptide repeat protein [Terriglobales bacterium]|nr:tetratricopeptide repeat protein [Terriglobales bacterium]